MIIPKDFCVFLDAGHGGVGRNGYTTYPKKCYRHPSANLHGDGWFYEGVFNRRLVNIVAQRLKQINIPYFFLHGNIRDAPLRERVTTANHYHTYYPKGILISSHANAYEPDLSVEGYEIFTTPEDTASDMIAELHYQYTRSLFGDLLKYRTDLSDGDHDKEAKFYMLTKSTMPAILIEHGFFTNLEEAQMMMTETYMSKMAEAQIRTILQWIDHINQK